MKVFIELLLNNSTLTEQQAFELFSAIMSGNVESAQMGAVLVLIQQRNASVDEVVGAARAMREASVPFVLPSGWKGVDTCGTGGDHAGTFNVSTAASFVVAACAKPHGVCVAKHGNKAVTSNSGSSQVLEALGVTLTASAQVMQQSVEQAGISFMFAPYHHPAMRYAAPVRQSLGIRTIFNVLGPLTNPAGVKHQVLGVWDESLLPLMSAALQRLGAEHACVVQGDIPGLGKVDEPTPFGKANVCWVKPSDRTTETVEPTQPLTDPSVLQVDNATQSAALIQMILSGEQHPARHIVAESAAYALYVADVAKSIADGRELAYESLSNGSALSALRILARITKEATV